MFDDPVSSLDYKWRENVARRLVEEAKTRQVIVFTHDVVFLLLLKQFAAEKGVSQRDQHVRKLSKGAGVCAEELPWVALKVSKRIGHLKNLLQDAEKLHRNGHQDAYEKDASLIYGYLREAWERGLEEVLLGGVVERYRPSIQTRRVALISDIRPEDCEAVETAMTKCSKWLRGHDQAAAARADIPEPAVLRADIEALADWRAEIRNRRTKESVGSVRMSKVNIKRAVENIRANTTVYTPVVEMIVNAIQAIDESERADGKVTVFALRNSQAEIDGSLPDVTGFNIQDNGIGFTDEHRGSFDTLYTDHRITQGGKGFGRFICLKYFEGVHVKSVYREGSGFKSRSFSMGKNHDIIVHEKIMVSEHKDSCTFVSLTGLKKGPTFEKKLSTVARNLVERLLPIFHHARLRMPDYCSLRA